MSRIVRHYIVKARIDTPRKGSHVLRHCFATRMVRAGHPLKSVADVLGHRRLSTTFIYYVQTAEMCSSVNNFRDRKPLHVDQLNIIFI